MQRQPKTKKGDKDRDRAKKERERERGERQGEKERGTRRLNGGIIAQRNEGKNVNHYEHITNFFCKDNVTQLT